MVMVEQGNFLEVVKFPDLSAMDVRALEVADEARKRALNQELRTIMVGVAVWARVEEEDKVALIHGFNVEHEVLQSCTCGEHAGLIFAYLSGFDEDCVGITVVAQRLVIPRRRIITPCDGCRPRLRQAASFSGVGDNFRIVMSLPNYKREKILIVSLGRLLSDPDLRYSRRGIDPDTLPLGKW